MTLRVVAAMVLLVGVAMCGLVSTVVRLNMVDELNEKLPPEQRFEPLGWYLTKQIRFHNEYDRLCPNSHRRKLARYLLVLMFTLLVGVAVLLGLLS